MDAPGRLDGAAFADQLFQLADLIGVTGRTEAVSGLQSRSASIDGGLHCQLQLFAFQSCHVQDGPNGNSQLAKGREFLDKRARIAIGQGAEIRHDIKLLGAMGGTPLRFGQLEFSGNCPEGKADGCNQAGACLGGPDAFPQQRQLTRCGADRPHALLHSGVTEGLKLVLGQQGVEDRLIKPGG